MILNTIEAKCHQYVVENDNNDIFKRDFALLYVTSAAI